MDPACLGHKSADAYKMNSTGESGESWGSPQATRIAGSVSQLKDMMISLMLLKLAMVPMSLPGSW